MRSNELSELFKDTDKESLLRALEYVYKKLPGDRRSLELDEILEWMAKGGSPEAKQAEKLAALPERLRAFVRDVRDGEYLNRKELYKLQGRSWKKDLKALAKDCSALAEGSAARREAGSLLWECYRAVLFASNFGDEMLPGMNLGKGWNDTYGYPIALQALGMLCGAKSPAVALSDALKDCLIPALLPHPWTQISKNERNPGSGVDMYGRDCTLDLFIRMTKDRNYNPVNPDEACEALCAQAKAQVERYEGLKTLSEDRCVTLTGLKPDEAVWGFQITAIRRLASFGVYSASWLDNGPAVVRGGTRRERLSKFISAMLSTRSAGIAFELWELAQQSAEFAAGRRCLKAELEERGLKDPAFKTLLSEFESKDLDALFQRGDRY